MSIAGVQNSRYRREQKPESKSTLVTNTEVEEEEENFLLHSYILRLVVRMKASIC